LSSKECTLAWNKNTSLGIQTEDPFPYNSFLEHSREPTEVTMDEKKVFETERAAITGGPYSQAIIHNGIIYLSSQGPIDPLTNQLIQGTIEQETELTFENIRIILEEAGSSLNHILQVNVYLIDMREYCRFNDVYSQYFPKDPPARTCIQVARLPFDIRVEIDAIAYI
jgi:2-iminobutanoate/2-iminopropanoate deaminase